MYGRWLHWLTLITGLIVGILSAVSWKIYNLTLVGDNFHRSNYDNLHQQRSYIDLQSLDNQLADELIPDELTKSRMNSLQLTCLIHIQRFKSLSTLNQTWTTRCDQSFFYISPKDLPTNSTLPSVDNIALIKRKSSPSVTSRLLSSWQLFCLTLLTTDFSKSKYSSADWILIGPSNVFIVVENLRRYLVSFNSSDRLYLGLPTNNHAQFNYNSFDSGIVLSRSAFNLLMDTIKLTGKCDKNYLPSKRLSLDRRVDVSIGQILNAHGIRAIDTRDRFGRARFLALPLGRHIVSDNIPFDHTFWQHNVYPFPNGPDCCSDNLISVAGLTMNQMRFYYYLMYKLRVNGRYNPIIG